MVNIHFYSNEIQSQMVTWLSAISWLNDLQSDRKLPFLENLIYNLDGKVLFLGKIGWLMS